MNTRAKPLFYVLIATLIGLVLAIEDTLNESSLLKSVIEFIVFVPLITVTFIALGYFGAICIRYWRKTTFYKNRAYADLLFGFGWVLGISLFISIIRTLVTYFIMGDDDGTNFFDGGWFMWVTGLLIGSIVMVVEQFWDILINQQRLALQNERLKRSQDLAKYQALVHQINPHFLFNSMNVLSVLVYKNPKAAEQFIEELSKMYRYILQLNEAYLVPLKKELEFINSYIYLQKIRYQGNLQFHTKVNAESLNQLIPPLTLELLVENAIKHNAIGEDTPLHIELHTENGYLTIKNPIQPRLENKIPSTKVGLKNLLEKYTLLESELPEFYTNDGQFIAQIPLIQPEL